MMIAVRVGSRATFHFTLPVLAEYKTHRDLDGKTEMVMRMCALFWLLFLYFYST